MRVMSLVTDADSQFFRAQTEVLADEGVESTVFQVPGDHEYSDEGDGKGRRSVLDYLKFYPPVLRHSFDDYDLIHANYGLTAPAALAQPNLPVVVSLWGSDLMGDYGRISALCARRADAVIVMSDEMADRLDCATHVIPHGIDLDLFRPVPQDDARRELGWDGDVRSVLYPYPPGRAVKNYPRAERVVDLVRERVDEPVALRTASGEDHERMPYYYSAADVMLLTSEREGSPNTVKEAMACNLPVVATDVGDVADRLEPVSRSHVATTDEALATRVVAVLEAGERSDGRDAVRPLSHQRMGERIRAVYEDVLSN